MAVELHEYSDIAVQTELAGLINDSATAANVVDDTGWPTGAVGTFYVVFDAGLSTEEIVKVSANSGGSLTIDERGANGTTAHQHSAGATASVVFTAAEADELNKHAGDTDRDDHLQYLHLTNARTVGVTHDWTEPQNFDGANFGESVVFEDDVHFEGQISVVGWDSDSGIAPITPTGGDAGTSNFPPRMNHSHGLDIPGFMPFFNPTGHITLWPGTAAPAGYLVCDGAEKNRVAFADLYHIIGTRYGVGNGSTTFNIPNMTAQMAELEPFLYVIKT